jgi:glutamate---cysteine ligase / carboxylate-amine ligase
MDGVGAESSVDHHSFGSGAPYTLGVEEEYMLLDPATFDLVQRADRVLAAEESFELADHLSPELFQSLLEVHTPVCANAAEAERQLRRLRSHVHELGRKLDLRVGSAGTHPFSLFERQRITPRDRYHGLVEQLQYIARRELIFGLHVHTAVDDPDKAIHVMGALLPHLAELVALSSSSPFWRGSATGLHSSRQSIFAAFPRSGPPPRFRDYADFAEVVAYLERTGCIADYTHIWWDVRPHPRFGTVEVRVMDGVSRVEDAAALAAYVQALVKLYSEAYNAGQPLPAYHRILTSENKWLAIRHGLEAPLIDLATGSRIRVSAARLVRRTLRDIEPHARELGSDRELEGINRILLDGSGAEEQLRVFKETRDIGEVARRIADLTEAAVGVAA